MRRVPVVLAAAAVVLLGLTAVSCDDESDRVTVGEVVRGGVAEIVDAPATVVARAVATLTAPADGTLAELRVEPGEMVTAGQVLAVVDSPAARRQLEQAEEALAAAQRAAAGGVFVSDLGATQAALDEAAAAAFDHAREVAAELADEDLREALLAQVDAAEQRYEAAAAAARETVRAVQQGVASLGQAVAAIGAAQRIQAEQAYELAKAAVDSLTLRAPIDGVVQLGGAVDAGAQTGLDDLLRAATGAGALPGPVAAPDARPGVDQAVAEGVRVTAGTPLLTVVDTTSLGLVAEVDETDVLLVTPGIRAEVELDAAPGARYQAVVTSVDVLPTPSTRGGVGYRVRLDLSGGAWPDGTAAPAPRPGMSAVVYLRVREATGVPVVPASAVLRVEGVDVVWRVRDDGRAERVPVQLGVQGPDLVEVVSGLEVGDRIVVGDADRVTEGQRLR